MSDLPQLYWFEMVNLYCQETLILYLNKQYYTSSRELWDLIQLASGIAGVKGECPPPKKTKLRNLEHCVIEWKKMIYQQERPDGII